MPQTLITFKISEEVARILEDYAKKHGMSKSEVVRRAIMEYLKRHGYRRLPPALSPVPRHDPRRSLIIEVDV